jgi:hypothetical protein
MQYKVIEAKGEAADLQDEVNRHIEEGWAPVGGVAVAYSPQTGNWWYYQALVKESGDTESK